MRKLWKAEQFCIFHLSGVSQLEVISINTFLHIGPKTDTGDASAT